MDDSIIVPIKLDAEKVKMLVSFRNSTDWEEMGFFVEDILRAADKVTLKLHETTNEIMKENPFSQKYL